MQVLRGWSGETKLGEWNRLDVTVDEVDFRRILIDHDISLDSIELIPSALVFVALTSQADKLLAFERMSMGHDEAKAVREIEDAKRDLDAVINKIKAGLERRAASVG